MERLTYDFTVGGNHCWQVRGADNLMCEEVCIQYSEKGCKECPIGKAIDRLAHYEDLEEQGRLVELPCKVGDYVWLTAAYGRFFDSPVKGVVHQFILHDDELVYLEAIIKTDIGEGKKNYGYATTSFEKIVFLSRPEAEAALAASGKEG